MTSALDANFLLCCFCLRRTQDPEKPGICRKFANASDDLPANGCNPLPALAGMQKLATAGDDLQSSLFSPGFAILF